MFVRSCRATFVRGEGTFYAGETAGPDGLAEDVVADFYLVCCHVMYGGVF